MRRLFLALPIFAAAVLTLAARPPAKAPFASASLASRTYLPLVARRMSLTPQPPIIEIGALPPELHVGVPISVDLNVYDPNGDLTQVTVSQQLGMGDRYAGHEYVTAQELELLTLDNQAIVLQAQYPGNYRVWVRAQDLGANASEKGLDVPVRLSAPPSYPIRAMALGCQFWPETVLPNVGYTLDRLISVGATHIALVPVWYVEDYTDYTIEPWYRDKPGFPENQTWNFPTLYDSEIRSIIQQARQRGLGIVLKPHVDPLDAPFGGIGRYGLQPSGGNWDGLFESYRDFSLHYAQIAEEEGVEIYVVGTELESMTFPELSGVDNPDMRWRALIASVREVYHGRITYSTAIHGDVDDLGCPPCKITFWDACDLIGVELYKDLTKDDYDPSVSDLQVEAERFLALLMEPLAERYGLPILIPEIAYHSFDGVAMDPIGLSAHSNALDWDEQARLHTAVLQAISSNKPWLSGVVWWEGYIVGPNDDLSWVEQDTHEWIWTKPAESVFRYFWTTVDDPQ